MLETPRLLSPNWAVPPGDLVQDLMDSLKLDRAELAKRMDITLEELVSLLCGKLFITEGIAIRLVLAFERYSARFWLNMEANYRRDLKRLGLE